MPLITLRCKNCNLQQEIYVVSQNLNDEHRCSHCNQPMVRVFIPPHSNIDSMIDTNDVGKVIQEKNERLKKQYQATSKEQQSLREKVNELYRKRMEKLG